MTDDEIRIVDPETGGEKGRKPARFDLVPADALWAIAEHFGRGAEKYSRWVPVTHDTPASELVPLCTCESIESLRTATPIGDIYSEASSAADATRALASSEIVRTLSAEHGSICGITKAHKRTSDGVVSLEFDRNWEKGYDWSLSFGAMMRHAWAWWGGEDLDEETGSSHMVAVAWHAMVLVANEMRQSGTDDRPAS